MKSIRISISLVTSLFLALLLTGVIVNPAAADGPPVAQNDSYNTPYGVALHVASPGVLANDSDPQQFPLTSTLITPPSHGTFALSDYGAFDYEPDPGYGGPDSFTYEVRSKSPGAPGGELIGNTATVELYVTVKPPIGYDDAYSTNRNTPFAVDAASGVLANDIDPNEGALTVWWSNVPQHGSLTLNVVDGSFVYEPSPGFVGDDTFEYSAHGPGGSAVQATTVIISVLANDQPPVGVDDDYSTPMDTKLVIDATNGVLVNDYDPDWDSMEVGYTTAPQHGNAALNPDGSFSYSPDPGFIGTDTVTYKVLAFGAYSQFTTVTINVLPVNHAPVGVDDSYSTPENTKLVVDVANGIIVNDTDQDGDAIHAILVTSPQHGFLVFGTFGTFTYNPSPGFVGTDTFQYSAEDAQLASVQPATVTITVTAGPQKHLPVGVDDVYTTPQDTTLTVDAANGVLANDSDQDGDALAAGPLAPPSHGKVTAWDAATGAFTYEPDAGYVGTDTFQYMAQDVDGNALQASTVTITVTAAQGNQPPVAVDDMYATSVNTPLDETAAAGILANDADPDGDPLTVDSPSSTSHGTVLVNSDGSFHYEPGAGFAGTDFFTYWVSAAGESSKTFATVGITVGGGPVKHLPVGVDDVYSTPQDTMLTVASANSILVNDTDQDGDTLEANVVLGPMHSQSFTWNPDGTFSYEPLPGYVGDDTFHYVVSDVDGNALYATLVTIHVTPTGDPGPTVTPAPTEDPGSDVTPEPTEPVGTPGVGTPEVTPSPTQPATDGSPDPSPTALVITTLPNTGSGAEERMGTSLAGLLLLIAACASVGFALRRRAGDN